MDELTQHDLFYTGISNNELQTITDETGCQAPCTYREIRQVGTPTDTTGIKGFIKKFTFGPTLVSTTLRTETEKLIVPFETLISNIGGTLGLFLGFSFILIWDWIEFVCNFGLAIRH